MPRFRTNSDKVYYMDFYKLSYEQHLQQAVLIPQRVKHCYHDNKFAFKLLRNFIDNDAAYIYFKIDDAAYIYFKIA